MSVEGPGASEPPRDAHRRVTASPQRRTSSRRYSAGSSPLGAGSPSSRSAGSRSSRSGPRRGRPAPRTGHRPGGWLLATGLTGLVALVGAVVWVLWESPLFTARSVQVIGTQELSAEEVRTAAAVPLGTPIVRLDTGQVRARVAALPRVAAVEVSRTLSGPGVLGGVVRIAVVERTPIAVWPTPEGTRLVDAGGTAYALVPDPPLGLPELHVAHAAPGDRATMAALTVLTGLPVPLRTQVLSVGAQSAADVVLRLTEGREVRWGGVEAGDRKAAVLVVLLTQSGEVYDVSSPDLPTIS